MCGVQYGSHHIGVQAPFGPFVNIALGRNTNRNVLAGENGEGNGRNSGCAVTHARYTVFDLLDIYFQIQIRSEIINIYTI